MGKRETRERVHTQGVLLNSMVGNLRVREHQRGANDMGLLTASKVQSYDR